jgi:hypothetical protein
MNTKFLSFFRIILLAVIFMQATITQAQEEYQQQIDNIFKIPASKIPSGILLDRSPAILDMTGLGIIFYNYDLMNSKKE